MGTAPDAQGEQLAMTNYILGFAIGVLVMVLRYETHVTNYYEVYPDGSQKWLGKSKGAVNSVYLKHPDLEKELEKL
jgi:hypothetical protein